MYSAFIQVCKALSSSRLISSAHFVCSSRLPSSYVRLICSSRLPSSYVPLTCSSRLPSSSHLLISSAHLVCPARMFLSPAQFVCPAHLICSSRLLISPSHRDGGRVKKLIITPPNPFCNDLGSGKKMQLSHKSEIAALPKENAQAGTAVGTVMCAKP